MTWTWASPNDFSIPISYLLHDLALPIFFHLKRPSLSGEFALAFLSEMEDSFHSGGLHLAASFDHSSLV